MRQVPVLNKPMNIHAFKRRKQQQQKISMLTCYDYPSARTIAESNIDCVLVGDSVAMVVHGYDSTIMATMDMMVLHTQAVARGLSKQFIVSDLPFLAYREGLSQTVQNVKSLIQAGAHAIKLEGADHDALRTIEHLVQAGIPVMGHIGLTPQSVHQLGGHRVQGKADTQALRLIEDAKALEEAGCFAIVIECVPQTLASTITQALTIPTIGIGAGPDTDGQILVWHDVLGLHSDVSPRFVKQFAQCNAVMQDAINAYSYAIHQADFPSLEHAF